MVFEIGNPDPSMLYHMLSTAHQMVGTGPDDRSNNKKLSRQETLMSLVPRTIRLPYQEAKVHQAER